MTFTEVHFTPLATQAQGWEVRREVSQASRSQTSSEVCPTGGYEVVLTPPFHNRPRRALRGMPYGGFEVVLMPHFCNGPR